MSRDPVVETLSGQLQQLLFSPKGGIEGLLLTVGDKTVQVSMKSTSAAAKLLAKSVGKAIEVTAESDSSPKTKGSAHPVFELERITKLAGKAFKSDDAADLVSGVVAAIHYARHGEPNGVILKSGEFIHTRPHGMKKLKLGVGSTVIAHGEVRMTVLGTSIVEAHQVNRVKLE